MNQFTNISPLPFYPKGEINAVSLNKYVCPIITYKNMLMPFQVNVDKAVTKINTVTLHQLDTGLTTDITSAMVRNGLALTSVGNLKVLRYPAGFPIGAIAEEGRYKLEISVSDLIPGSAPSIFEVYESEPFTSINNVDGLLKLTYGNTRNLEATHVAVDFSGDFHFEILLQTSVGRPDYNYEVDAVSRGGYTFVKSTTSKKTYKFSFIATEGMIDALRLIKLCDTITIESKGKVYQPISISLDAEWVNKDDTASVSVEFDTDNIVSAFSGVIPVEDAKVEGPHFNSDYNEDFKIKNT